MFDLATWTDPFKVEEAYPGIERRVLAFNDEMMTVHYTVERGAEFPAHEHETTQQSVYVLEGEIELFGEHETTLAEGDSFVVGPNVEHGVRGVAPRSELIDSFSPPIAEYADASGEQ